MFTSTLVDIGVMSSKINFRHQRLVGQGMPRNNLYCQVRLIPQAEGLKFLQEIRVKKDW